MLVHELREAVVVVAFQEMHEFVDDDVFEALDRLLGEFEVQPHAATIGVAGAPLGFHSFDSRLCGRHFHARLHFAMSGGINSFKLLSIPALQNLSRCAARFAGRTYSSIVELLRNNRAGPIAIYDAEAVALPKKVVALAANYLPLGLPRLGFEFRPLAVDPAELADHRKPDGVIAHPQRRRHAHAAVRRVDAEMQVLDALPDDLDRQSVTVICRRSVFTLILHQLQNLCGERVVSLQRALMANIIFFILNALPRQSSMPAFADSRVHCEREASS